MILVISSAAITCFMCYGMIIIFMWYLRRRRLYELASKFKGPLALPLIGSAHMLIGNTEHILSTIVKLTETYPTPCRFWLGLNLYLLVTDPEQIKEICRNSNSLGKGDLYTHIGGPLLGEGLITAPVPKWKVHRKLIQPTFNTNILNTFFEVFAVQAKIFNQQMERHLDGPEFELFNPLALCTLDMICETVMGVKVGAQAEGSSQYVETLQEVAACLLRRFLDFWMHPDFIFYRTKLGKDHRKGTQYLHSFTDNVIRIKQKELLNRKSRQPGTDDHEDDGGDSKPRREAFLDLLMKLTNENGNLSDEELRDEVTNMVMAGYDTTAATASFLMLMLASHSDIQEKVYQELNEIYGGADVEEHPVTAKDLTRMKYMERVIKETMRLLPIIPFIPREITEDLDVGGCTFPKGSFAVMSILSLHRSEKYWPDPLKFDPDRFLPEEIAKRHPSAYIPFSSGPRNCIGLNYAMMSMKTTLATILRRYRLKKDNIVPVKDIRLKYEVLLKTVDPITLRIEKRTGN